jgi:serine/threonine protein kinase
MCCSGSQEAVRQLWVMERSHTWREASQEVNARAARLSRDCRNLVDRMLEPNEQLRITIKEIKQHPW